MEPHRDSDLRAKPAHLCVRLARDAGRRLVARLGRRVRICRGRITSTDTWLELEVDGGTVEAARVLALCRACGARVDLSRRPPATAG